jgi:hypothetical protein
MKDGLFSCYPPDNFGWSELVGLVAGPWKIIQAPRPEFYNLENDPGESKNIFGSSAQKAGELSNQLRKEILRLSSGVKPSKCRCPDRLCQHP